MNDIIKKCVEKYIEGLSTEKKIIILTQLCRITRLLSAVIIIATLSKGPVYNYFLKALPYNLIIPFRGYISNIHPYEFILVLILWICIVPSHRLVVCAVKYSQYFDSEEIFPLLFTFENIFDILFSLLYLLYAFVLPSSHKYQTHLVPMAIVSIMYIISVVFNEIYTIRLNEWYYNTRVNTGYYFDGEPVYEHDHFIYKDKGYSIEKLTIIGQNQKSDKPMWCLISDDKVDDKVCKDSYPFDSALKDEKGNLSRIKRNTNNQ